MWQATSCTGRVSQFAGLTWGYFEKALQSALCLSEDEGDASFHLAGGQEDWADAT